MTAINHANGGSFTKHVVAVAIGPKALQICNLNQSGWGHQCVLDTYCFMDSTTNPSAQMKFNSLLYNMATVQKIVWAREVIKLGFSAFFVDMDVILLRNPLPWLGATFHHADMAFSSENCAPWAGFQEDYIRWRPGQVFWQNIGAYFVNPTLNAFSLLEVWIALARNVLIQGLPTTGQNQLNRVLFDGRKLGVPGQARTCCPLTGQDLLSSDRLSIDADGQVHVAKSAYVVNKTELALYRVGFKRFNTLCGGWCGCDHLTWERRNVLSDAKTQVVRDLYMCNMTDRDMDDLFSFHMNCQSDVKVKQTGFRIWSEKRVIAAAL
ncbi:hypothetical protein CEUSTIGMA_g12075.t1 [Chlamydomonas eustigma]|uniref:Nucleotide-diphospho-sugar transferase domain-containing protein n=1 Tax=Chlamydomonas eustigma TaxID=1157962 RepID=A0A250XNI4_9CHLO|nr:hypothetical protein CEUSTIGMA_g12075.t1 [Chlamydomonas eustigma]|eukprot:GAX84654.1 hypothetical protein CEUSTIGMA_g12075.t1 [Chlamydomonas eustigma]